MFIKVLFIFFNDGKLKDSEWLNIMFNMYLTNLGSSVIPSLSKLEVGPITSISFYCLIVSFL